MNLKLRTLTLRMAASVLAISAAAYGQTNDNLNVFRNQSGPLVVRSVDGHAAHMMPTVQKAKQFGLYNGPGIKPNLDWGPLVYAGGASSYVMPSLQIYMIFWVPSSGKLQDGTTATTLSAGYQSVQKTLASRIGGHSLDSLISQYYQTISGVTTYIAPTATLAGYTVDTNSYPTSQCYGKTNCITDAQLRTEISNVMTAHSWTGGMNKLFMVFTSNGENSCFDGTSTSACSYSDYCGYHSAYGATYASATIYSNEPYADTNACWLPSNPVLHSEVAADAASSVASHEIFEAATDPFGNAWYTAQGNEIGDLCAWNFGLFTWYGGRANENWGGSYFELQQEWDNHTAACELVGP